MIASTSIVLGEEFNWKVAEVVNIQGNMYGYLGYESITSNMVTMRLAKWQNGWMELTFSFTYVAPPYGPRLFQNFTLSPYILEVSDFQYFNLTARFIKN